MRLHEATDMPFVLEVNAPLRAEAARFRALHHPEIAERIEKNQFRGATAVAAVSAAIADHVIAGGASPERVRILPNGVDPTMFHPAVGGGKIHARHGLSGKRVIGFVGRARPWHDLDTLLQAFAGLYRTDRRYHLLLVGEMPIELEKQLACLGIGAAVTMTGPVPHSAVPAHIAAMTVAVSCHTPTDDFYFSPLKLFEYLACGIPTVAADLGQPSALIRPGLTGELYPPGDVEALAGAIDKIVRSPDYAAELGWRGAALVLEQHTWEQNAAQVVSFIRPQPAVDSEAASKIYTLPILDAKLKQRLYRATRPDLAEALLRRRVPLRKSRTPLTTIEVLKYKPERRCVLRYTWEERPGRIVLQLIGKVFKDERGQRLDAVHRLLRDNGLGCEDIRIPLSHGYVRKIRMQLQEAVRGDTLNDLYRANGNIRDAIPLCARGLTRLHSLKDGLLPASLQQIQMLVGKYGLAEELERLVEIGFVLTELRPGCETHIQRMRQRLDGWGRSLESDAAPVLIHRDFYYSQVLIENDDRLTIIDLDLLAIGDSAIDVANFSAHLHFLALETTGDFHALAGEAGQFRAAYQAARPMPPEFWHRVAFYEAATLFRLLRVVAVRPNKQPVFEPLLAELAGILEDR